MADALDVLREMHVAAKSAFQDIEQSSPNERGPMWTKLKQKLKLHEQMEERFIYRPVAEDVQNPLGVLENWYAVHEAQVTQVETIMDRIDEKDPEDAAWMEEVRLLKATMEEHIQQEEAQIWPEIRRQWGSDNLDQRHTQIQAAKAAGQAGATVASAMDKATQAFRR